VTHIGTTVFKFWALICYCTCYKSTNIFINIEQICTNFLVWCNLFFSTGKNKVCPVHNYLSSVWYVWVSWLTGGHIQDPQMYTFHYYQLQVIWCAC